MAYRVVEPDSNMNEEKTECGCCFEYNGRLVMPKVLPCKHVCCLPYLQKDVEAYSILRCAICRKVYDMKPQDLPSADRVEEMSIFCQPCKRNEEFRKAAVYCVKCETKFCVSHQKSHDDCFTHALLSMEEYKSQYHKLAIRHCSEHPAQLLNIGCKTCHAVLCLDCLNTENKGTDGGVHIPIGLELLLKALKESVDDRNQKAKDRVSMLEILMIFCKQALADHDTETENLMDLIEKTKTQQVEAIEKQYELQKESLARSRQRRREEIFDFMESEVGAVRHELDTIITRLDADHSNTNMADLISLYNKIQTDLESSIETDVPALRTDPYEYSLQHIGTRREPELRLEQEQKCLVVNVGGISRVGAVPHALRLIKKVNLQKTALSICIDDESGNCYVGLASGIVVAISNSFADHKTFVSLPDNVNGLCLAGDSLLALTHNAPWVVNRIDLKTGACSLQKGVHPYEGANYLKIVSPDGQNEFIVPRPASEGLCVYDMQNEYLRAIPIPTLSNTNIGMGSLQSEDLLIAVTDYNKVYLICRVDEGVAWTVDNIDGPSAVCVDDMFVFVADSHKRVIILDNQTGKRLGEMEHDGDPGYVHDLCVWKDRLIMNNGSDIHVYEMEYPLLS